jgi:signal transduction histidine kinase
LHTAKAVGKIIYRGCSGCGITPAPAIENVVRNAVKHTAEATQAVVHLKPEVNAIIELSISDHGRGVPVDEFDSTFRLFFSGSLGRDDMYGLGLGLLSQHAPFMRIAAQSVPQIWAVAVCGLIYLCLRE